MLLHKREAMPQTFKKIESGVGREEKPPMTRIIGKSHFWNNSQSSEFGIPLFNILHWPSIRLTMNYQFLNKNVDISNVN